VPDERVESDDDGDTDAADELADETEINSINETPRNKIQVVVYTPSKIGAVAEQTSHPAISYLSPVDDDGQFASSTSHYGTLAWDNSDDEVDSVQSTSKNARPRSTRSGSNGEDFQALDYGQGKRKRNSSLNSQVLVRDSNGRFTRSTGTPASTTSSKNRRSSKHRENSSMEFDENGALSSRPKPQRDENGRFKSIPGTPAVKKVKKPRILTISNSKAVVVRDDAGRSMIDGPLPAITPPIRDNNGRFAPKSTSASIQQTKRFMSVGKDPSSNEDSESDLAEASAPKKPIAKTKRAPATSLYFTPTTTPSKGKVKVENTDKSFVDILSRSRPPTPTTPRTPRSGTPSSTPKRPRTPGGIVSCIPFPPLSSPTFGLIQEKLATDPFRLLIAVTFLIRTHGKHAIPVFFELMEKYPTPESLAAADKGDIVPIIRHLGLQNQRAGTYQMYANIWLEDPPRKGRRYAVRGYPTKDSSRNVPKDEILSDTDKREAWEIGHMTQGPYALDSWRIFCRDVLRGVADGWNGEATEEGFQPEWMRVVPEDKELRAFLRWMWLKEGFEWDPFTGEKEVASEPLMRAAMEGRISWDDRGGMRILDSTEEVLGLGVE
jgi:methyl-CpG-binding domain protein 4